jgi:hypothetical protein
MILEFASNKSINAKYINIFIVLLEKTLLSHTKRYWKVILDSFLFRYNLDNNFGGNE